MHRLVDALFILRPVILAGHYARACRRSDDKTDQKLDDRSAGAYSRQGVTTHHVAYDHRIHHAVQLLKQIAQYQWNREQKQFFPNYP